MTDWADRARALLAKATPGPWKVHRCSYAEADIACGLCTPDHDCHEYANIVGDLSYDECHHPMSRGDAELAAAAPTLLQEALAERDALRASYDELHDQRHVEKRGRCDE